MKTGLQVEPVWGDSMLWNARKACVVMEIVAGEGRLGAVHWGYMDRMEVLGYDGRVVRPCKHAG